MSAHTPRPQRTTSLRRVSLARPKRVRAARPTSRASVFIAPLGAVDTSRRVGSAAGRRPHGDIYIAPEALARFDAHADQASVAGERRELDAVVHRLLTIGLATSASLMVAGLALGLGLHRDLPETMPTAGEMFRRVVALRPSGFLALGLLVLIATPILRVVGSIVAFIFERDWRFAGIETVVLLAMLASLVLGKGG